MTASAGTLDSAKTATSNYSANGYRNVASWREPGVQIVVSSHDFRGGGKHTQELPCPLNRGLPAPNEPSPCNWISNRFQHLPQWVWVHFPGPRRIDKVVLYATNMATSPLEFSGEYLPHKSSAFHTVFHVHQARFDARTLSYTVYFKPVVTTNLRLVIEQTTASTTPQSWIAELSQLEVYGVNAESSPQPPVVIASAPHVTPLAPGFHPTKFLPQVSDTGRTLDIRTQWYRLVLDKSHPQILFLSWDSLGLGDLSVNFLDRNGAHPVFDPVFKRATTQSASKLTSEGNVFYYAPIQIAPHVYEQIVIRTGQRGFELALAAKADCAVMMRGGLFRFHFAANQTPTTFVPNPFRIMNYVAMPTYLAAPDFGTAYVTRTGDQAAFYRTPSSLFPASTYWIDVTPHQPATEDGLNTLGPRPWHVAIHFSVQRLVPLPALVNQDSRLQRFPKYSLNMTQWRPDTGIVGNSVMSIGCGLAMLFYAQQAVFTPHLNNDISPMALVGASIDRYFQGAHGYQMPDRNVFDPDWHSSRETAAYLIISAWYVIRTIGGMKQLHRWLSPTESLANHLESNFGSDGLIYHSGTGTMWFDTYNIQGADAYSNAADYRAFQCMVDLETLAGRPSMAERYRKDAHRIQAVYFKSFYDSNTGVLAGWRTKNGKLHDYMFPWVNGFAIYQGLIPPQEAKSILQRLLAKMQSIGFHSYQLGLPTNLIPMSPADYFPHTSGAPKQPDGMDTWQIYMNGGATPALEYYFLQALYQTGQYQAAENLLWPLMRSYERGTFNAGIQLPGVQQRNPIGSAFYRWDGSHGAGEGYLPEDWGGIDALFTGHYGIGFDNNGYYLESWSPLRGKKIQLDLPFMGKRVPYLNRQHR